MKTFLQLLPTIIVGFLTFTLISFVIVKIEEAKKDTLIQKCIESTDATDANCDSCFHAVKGVNAKHPKGDYSSCEK